MSYSPRRLAARHSKYRVLGRVGRGQFGAVHCAIDRRTGQFVALKEVDANRLTTHHFLRELRFLAMLQHENIVTWKTCEHFQEGRYLVMDYCEGGTLRHLMESQPSLPMEIILSIVLDILAGLAHVHDQGIIHCDLKPENILLRCAPAGWIAHISDFGIARLLHETLVNVDVLDAMAGSPAYMAPERFDGELNISSDIYAVGIMLHELLMGDRPFAGTPGTLIEAHRHKPLRLSQKIPLGLGSILQIALHKQPNGRFSSAREMHQAIEQWGATAQKLLRPVLPAAPVPAQTKTQTLLQGLPQPIEQIWRDRSDQIHCIAGQTFYSLTLDETANPRHLTGQTQIPEAAQFLGQSPPATSQQTRLILATEQALGQVQISPQGEVLPWEPIHPLAPDTQVALDPTGHWLALGVRDQNDRPGLEIWQMNPWRRRYCLALETQPWKLIFLDNRHIGVVYRSDPEQAGEDSQALGTSLALFTRRGQPLGQLNLPNPLVRLQVTPQPYLLAALEADAILQIKLTPFSLHRIPLSSPPQCLLSSPCGHIWSDRLAQIHRLSPQGKTIDRLDWGRQISAIAPLPKNHLGEAQLLVASKQQNGYALHQLSWIS